MTWAQNSHHSKIESRVAATSIVTVFLNSVERCFSVSVNFLTAVVRSLAQDWLQVTAEGGAQRHVCWVCPASWGLMEVKHE